MTDHQGGRDDGPDEDRELSESWFLFCRTQWRMGRFEARRLAELIGRLVDARLVPLQRADELIAVERARNARIALGVHAARRDAPCAPAADPTVSLHGAPVAREPEPVSDNLSPGFSHEP